MRQRVDPILAIGRNLEVCRTISDVLASEGYWVEWTTDLTTAPLRVSGHHYALLVAEADGTDGTNTALSAVAEIDPDLPVLLLADGGGHPPKRPAGVQVLAKPFASADLLERVRTFVRPVRPGRARS